MLDREPQVEEGVLEDVPSFPTPPRREDGSAPAVASEGVPAAGNLDEDERMDVDCEVIMMMIWILE